MKSPPCPPSRVIPDGDKKPSVSLAIKNVEKKPCYGKHLIYCISPRGGHSTFFQVGVCGPDFQSMGLANWQLLLKRGACERKIFKFWGLVSWKFPNLGACELKISKFGRLWTKIWAKIEAVEAKISKFSQKGVLWTDSFAWNGTLASGRRGVKRGSSRPHIPIPPF